MEILTQQETEKINAAVKAAFAESTMEARFDDLRASIRQLGPLIRQYSDILDQRREKLAVARKEREQAELTDLAKRGATDPRCLIELCRRTEKPISWQQWWGS